MEFELEKVSEKCFSWKYPKYVSLFQEWVIALFSANLMRIPRKMPEAFTEASSSVAAAYANCGIGLSVDAYFASCITCVTLRKIPQTSEALR